MTANTLHQWAQRWGIPPDAIADLAHTLTAAPPTHSGTSETSVINAARFAASEQNWRLFRNNVGACYTNQSRFLRYGLANESAGMNEQLKSSDLIGVRPVTIEASHVGTVLGQFVALECKKPGWVFRGTPREQAQYRFLALIEARGGHGRFTTGGLE